MSSLELVPIVVSVISGQPVCLACVAHKAGLSQLEAVHAIERIQRTFVLTTASGNQCGVCGSAAGPVYLLAR